MGLTVGARRRPASARARARRVAYEPKASASAAKTARIRTHLLFSSAGGGTGIFTSV